MRSARDLERQQPSRAYQTGRLHLAHQHLDALVILTSQPGSTAILAYDAIRAAVDAHANAASLQIAGDRHANSVEYAHVAFATLVDQQHLTTYDVLRTVRNKTLQYPDIGASWTPTAAEATIYAAAAGNIVAAVDLALG